MENWLIGLIVGAIFVISNIADYQKKKRQKAQREQERLRQSQPGSAAASQAIGQRTTSPIPGALRPLPRATSSQPSPPPVIQPVQPQLPTSLRDLFAALEKKVQEAQKPVISPRHVEAPLPPPPPIVREALPPPPKPSLGETVQPAAPTPVGILEKAVRTMPSGRYPDFDARTAILFSEILGPPVSLRPRHRGRRVN